MSADTSRANCEQSAILLRLYPLNDDANADLILALRDELDRAESERDAARVDAERYRFLVKSDQWNYTPPPMRAVRASWLCKLTKAELDAAIDAARGAK